MIAYYTEQQLIAVVPGLNQSRLVEFVEAKIVIPVEQEGRRSFRELDVARLTLACELGECFDVHDEALAMVLDLVDQLHGVRSELRAVLEAIDAQPPEQRRQIGAALQKARQRR